MTESGCFAIIKKRPKNLEGVSSLKYVVVLDFGYSIDPMMPSSIDDLAKVTMKNYATDEDVTVLAQEETYDRLLLSYGFPMRRLRKIEVGQSGTNGTSGGGSYHVLRRAKAMIIDMELAASGRIPSFPMMVELVAHELHVSRAVRQGDLFDLVLTKAYGLPKKLYPQATQWWCRNKLLWYFREAIGWLPLKLMGQI